MQFDLKPFRDVRIKYEKSPKANSPNSSAQGATKIRRKDNQPQWHISATVQFAEQTLLAKRLKLLTSKSNENNNRLSFLETRYNERREEEDCHETFLDFVCSNPMFNAQKDKLGRRLAVSQRFDLDAEILKEFVCNSYCYSVM